MGLDLLPRYASAASSEQSDCECCNIGGIGVDGIYRFRSWRLEPDSRVLTSLASDTPKARNLVSTKCESRPI